MPRKSPKNGKSLVAMLSRTPSRSPSLESPPEKPPYAVDTRKIRASSEAQRSPIETSKMADNCKDLKVRDDANSELPVASSSKSVLSQLEGFQAQQIRRSPGVSSKKENADINAASIESTTKGRKRSGTPLPKSFFENVFSKKDKADINAASIESAARAPKRSGTPLPKSFSEDNRKKMRMTPTQNQNNDDNNENQSPAGIIRLSNESDDGSPMAEIEIASPDSMVISARGLLAASGLDTYYLDQFHKFYADYRACNIKIAKRLLNLENTNIEQHYANKTLNSRLNEMKNKNKSLENKLALQEQLGTEWHEKYLNALNTRITIEKECQDQLQMAKLHINQQKAELDKNKSESDRLKAEFSNMTSAFSDLQKKLKETKATAANLLDQNNKQAAELEEQRLKMQDTAAELVEFEDKCFYLESELKEKTLECEELIHQALDFEGVMLSNDEMTTRIEELKATQTSLIQANEEFAKESVELNAQKQAHEETISSLTSTLDKQSVDLKKLKESHEKLETTNFQQGLLHSKELQKCEAQIMELQEIIKSLQNKLKDQDQALQAEQEKLIKVTHQSLGLKSELDGEKAHNQADMAALKTALEHRDRASRAEQAKLQSLVAELDGLRKMNSSLKNEKKQLDNQLAATKNKFEEDLKKQMDNLMNKMFALQEDLKKKETQLIALEHEKDAIIKQLKTKMNTICSTITQPIVASTIAKSPPPTKYSKRLLRKTQPEIKPTGNKPLSPSKEPKAAPIYQYSSDIESEDDVLPIKMLFTKRENLAVVKPQNDVFDSLKKGSI